MKARLLLLSLGLTVVLVQPFSIICPSRYVSTKRPTGPKPACTALPAKRKGPDEESWKEDKLLGDFDDLDGGSTGPGAVGDAVDGVESNDIVEDYLEDDDDDKIDEIALQLEEEEDDDGEGYEENNAAVSESTVEWDEDEDGGMYELEDDPEDANYMIQKQIAEAAAAKAEQKARDESFDAVDYIENEMTEEFAEEIESLDFMKEAEKLAAGLVLTEDDVKDVDLDADVPDLMNDDPYIRHDDSETNFLEAATGITDDDMEKLDNTYKEVQDILAKGNWNKVVEKDENGGWDNLPDATISEMEDCLEEIGGSAYNVTRWLLYDLDFNVSNLILSAIKHNPRAPVLLHHWYPQLVTYERYQHARDNNFDFTWEDVENADISELERYYAGFGYSEIPKKAPGETGMIGLEEMDEEEIKMASLEKWMTEVYNPEMDRKDFDDDDMQDEDNVFSKFYEAPQHPDLPKFEDAVEDLEDWEEEMGDDPSTNEYRDMMGKVDEYTFEDDQEFKGTFRGHLIVACSTDHEDLVTAEKITKRFEKEFGKSVFVETRVMSLAREEDNVFEIWLESYEIDLLHSKKRATGNTDDWDGPAECDDAQIDYLVDRVGFLISDDNRYSYRMELEHA